MTELVNPLPALRALVERTVRVADIVGTPMWCVAPRARAKDAADELAAREFDVAGVAEDPVTRYLTTERLASSGRTVAGAARPILAAHTVEKSLPLADLIETLRTRPFVFVLDDDRVQWVLTRADLQAPAVGIVTLAYLTAIEMALARVVPRMLRDWVELLPRELKDRAQKIYDRTQINNVAIGMEDCLYFSDWLYGLSADLSSRARGSVIDGPRICHRRPADLPS